MLRSAGITTLTTQFYIASQCLSSVFTRNVNLFLVPHLTPLSSALIWPYKCSNCYFFVVKNAHKWLLLLLPDGTGFVWDNLLQLVCSVRDKGRTKSTLQQIYHSLSGV